MSMCSRVCICILGLLLAPASWAAADPVKNSPLQSIYDCADITDNEARLACFDLAVQQVKTAETTGEIVAVDSVQMETLEREAFGFNLPSLPKLHLPSLGKFVRGDGKAKSAKKAVLADASQNGGTILEHGDKGEVSKIGVEVVRTKKKANGRYKFYMSSGNIWEQIDDKNVHIPRSGTPFLIEIRRAAMGSYLLRINGKGAAIRIRRRN